MKAPLLLALLAGHLATAQVKPSTQVLRSRTDLLRARVDSRVQLAPQLAQMVLSGQVWRVDSLKTVPLPGARVAVAPAAGAAASTTTDENGNFSLVIPAAVLAALPDSVPVLATAFSCQSQTIKVKKSARATVVFHLLAVRMKMRAAKITLPKKNSEADFWPPPQYSSLDVLNKHYFAKARTLADVDSILTKALLTAGYDDLRYYYAPEGFVLITRIEQTDAKGVALPGSKRWSVAIPDGFGSSFLAYLKALVLPPKGHFRVIAFAITDKPINSYRDAPSEDETRQWLQQGADVLDSEIGVLKYGRTYHCSALIYAFEQSDSGPATLVQPGLLTARQHLVKSHIVAALPPLQP